MGLKENLKSMINEAVKEVQERPLYPELQHKTLAKSYPEGEAAYFRKEIYDLLCEIPKHTGIGNAWINSGTPKVTGDMAINYYIELSNNKFYNFESDNDFLKFSKSDFTRFLRDYYAWAKFKENISTNDNKELTFYDILKCVDCKKNDIIDIISGIITDKKRPNKSIAHILSALSNLKYIEYSTNSRAAIYKAFLLTFGDIIHNYNTTTKDYDKIEKGCNYYLNSNNGGQLNNDLVIEYMDKFK